MTWASNGVGGQQIMLTSGGRGYIFDLRDDTFTPIWPRSRSASQRSGAGLNIERAKRPAQSWHRAFGG